MNNVYGMQGPTRANGNKSTYHLDSILTERTGSKIAFIRRTRISITDTFISVLETNLFLPSNAWLISRKPRFSLSRLVNMKAAFVQYQANNHVIDFCSFNEWELNLFDINRLGAQV